jgi:hypothetical protein
MSDGNSVANSPHMCAPQNRLHVLDHSNYRSYSEARGDACQLWCNSHYRGYVPEVR